MAKRGPHGVSTEYATITFNIIYIMRTNIDKGGICCFMVILFLKTLSSAVASTALTVLDDGSRLQLVMQIAVLCPLQFHRDSHFTEHQNCFHMPPAEFLHY